MKVQKTSTFQTITPNNSQDIERAVDKDLNQLFQCLNGRTRFGAPSTGTNGENISGQWLQITTNGTPNTESTFNHTVGAIPIGYIVVWQDKAGSLYQGPITGTAWTSTSVSLKCSVASVTFLLFLLR